uniref:IMP U3 small nucleolar ribonucleoprotein 4 n=1 Tax=Chrysemys picta bellii TaxID=8478 RepID=A0A8C3H5V5_CHRPI
MGISHRIQGLSGGRGQPEATPPAVNPLPPVAGLVTQQDDEYRWAGVEDPKVMITTSRDPSSRLKMFAKEMKLVVPGAQRMNRGRHEVGALLRACKANGVTDLLVLHEHRGQPDGLIVSHLPFGPTAFFTLCNVVMRHEVPDIGTMSEATPHLIFHNFTSRLGQRVCSILKYLFPVPKEDSKRVITFANQDDYISFRCQACPWMQPLLGRAAGEQPHITPHGDGWAQGCLGSLPALGGEWGLAGGG